MNVRLCIIRLGRFFRETAGTTTIEFAIVVLIFIVFWMGVMEFGRAMWVRNTLQTATEEAARYAMAHATVTDAQLITRATDYFEATGNTEATFTIVRDTASGVDFLTINGIYTFQSLFSIIDFGVVNLDARSRVPLTS